MSYIKEIFLHSNGHLKARNGTGRSANYTNSYDERKSGTHHKKRNSYKPSNNSAVVIIHDPLGFYNGGFRCGAIFGEEDWERMRSSRVITEGTIFKQNDRNGILCIWRMVTLKHFDGRRIMKRVRMEL